MTPTAAPAPEQRRPSCQRHVVPFSCPARSLPQDGCIGPVSKFSGQPDTGIGRQHDLAAVRVDMGIRTRRRRSAADAQRADPLPGQALPVR